jgi:hypothetical protein
MTLAPGSHAASYIFFLAAYAFLAAFVTGRRAHDEARRHLVLATLSVATMAWLGYNLYRDARTQASTIVTPARSAETLILMTEFDRRGTRVLTLSTRLREQFNETLQSNRLANVRVEAVPLDQARVADRTAARKLGERHNAAFVVWGWYDDQDAHPDLVVVPGVLPEQDLPRLSDFSRSAVDAAFRIHDGSPDELAFVVDVATAQLLLRAVRPGDARDVLADAEDSASAAKLSVGLDSLYFLQALAEQQVGADLNLVVDGYARALEANPMLAAAYLSRSLARAARGDAPDRVFADYARAVELEPRFVPFAYLSTRAFPAPLPPEPALARLREGLDAYRVGDYDAALQDFDDALSLQPAYAGTYYFRARVHHVRGEFQLAADDYTRFIDASTSGEPHYLAYTYYARALARRALSQHIAAAQDFNAYLKVATPDDPNRANAERYAAQY